MSVCPIITLYPETSKKIQYLCRVKKFLSIESQSPPYPFLIPLNGIAKVSWDGDMTMHVYYKFDQPSFYGGRLCSLLFIPAHTPIDVARIKLPEAIAQALESEQVVTDSNLKILGWNWSYY